MSLKEPFKILFIDGNDSRKKQTSSRLRMQNFDVEIAQGGFHSIYLVERESFGLIIIQGDELEDMPAEEVISLLRNIHTREELPIMAILAQVDDDVAADLANSGANEILINTGNFNLILKEIEKIQKTSSKKK
jgi:DNA-binding response OmpR family regulator